ncbi:MAG: cupin domain-containing protein [Actinomycetota bacterium]
MKDGRTLPSESYTKRARLQSRTIEDIIDPGRVLNHLAQGATVVLQALHRYWEPVTRFCRELELDLTHPVQINIYLTPPASRGLDVHYDTHDVFVLQVAGAKHWKVYGSAIDLPLAHQRRKGSYPEPGEAQIDIELAPGDCLYIPRGFLHAAETATSESAHMTVGILTYTWMDVLKAATEKATNEVFLRDALPPGFAHAPADMESRARAVMKEVAAWIERSPVDELMESVAERFWSGRPPLLTGQLQEVLAIDRLGDDSLVRRRAGAVCRLALEGDELVALLGDRRLSMPAHVEGVMRQILDCSEFKIDELASHLDGPSRIVLVRRLIMEGLLEQTPSD